MPLIKIFAKKTQILPLFSTKHEISRLFHTFHDGDNLCCLREGVLALATTSCPADIPKWVTGEKYDEEGMSGREEELFEEYQNICDKEINHEKPE